MTITIIVKVSVLTALFTSIIFALEIDDDTNTYFNDEMNKPPPQMETFNNYEEMKKYLENNSNVELIDNPTFDTYLSAYNLHHGKNYKPEISQGLSMNKRVKRRALPFPYDFIKFELSDAVVPNETTRELLKMHRQREMKSMETVAKEKNKQETEEKDMAEEYKEKDIIDTKIIETENKTLNIIKNNKTRRASRRTPRKKVSQKQFAAIKRIDFNIERSIDDSKSMKNESTENSEDLDIHESQNVHYYAAIPSEEGVSKHKLPNIFPHEVHKAIDFVLSESKPSQGNVNGGGGNGKIANLKFIQIPIYHKQPHYGDKIALYQASKISTNKPHPSEYNEASNKYLHTYALPITHTNDFKPVQSNHQNVEEQKHYQLNGENHNHNEHHHQQIAYYTPQASTNLQPLHEIKQSSYPLNTAVSHQSHIIGATADNDNSVHSKLKGNSLKEENISGGLSSLPEISPVHTIIHPHAVAVKIVPEINYVYHQDIAAPPVSLKLTPDTSLSAVSGHSLSSSINAHSSPSTENDKFVQAFKVEKSVKPPHHLYQNYKNYQQRHVQHTPIHLQNEMLAKTGLINHGYKFDDSTNLASSDGNTDHISDEKGNVESDSTETEDVNKIYSIKSQPLSASAHSYILHKTPGNSYQYAYSSSTPSNEILHNDETFQNHQQTLSVAHPIKYILKDATSSAYDSYNHNSNKEIVHSPAITSINYKDLSSLIGKTPTDQLHGLTYLIEKELQDNKLQGQNKIRPQDNRAPILFHPEQQNDGGNLKGKNVFINELGLKEIRNDNYVPAIKTSTEKPIIEEGNHHEFNNVVHITPPPSLQPPTSYKHVHNLSPNYKFGTKLYGLSGLKDLDSHALQYASKYAFGYRVRDFYTGNDFGHKQKRDHDGVTRGEYHILLPDGRVQNVRYTADDTGFHADVSFETGN